MKRRAKFREAAPIDKFSIPDFILLGLYSLENNKKACSFEELLQECYLLSPQTFSFPKKPGWPDARKIDRPLRTLRKKELVKGSPERSFSLTRKGRKIAQGLAKNLRQKKLFKD